MIGGLIIPGVVTIADVVLARDIHHVDVVEAAKENGFDPYIALETHVQHQGARFYQLARRGVSIDSEEFRLNARILAKVYHVLFHQFCENQHHGIKMSFQEAEIDYTERGYQAGFRDAWLLANPSPQTVLGLKNLKACVDLLGHYLPRVENLDQPLAENQPIRLPTGIYVRRGFELQPCPAGVLGEGVSIFDPLHQRFG